jgi:alpha-L-rhamnosidase
MPRPARFLQCLFTTLLLSADMNAGLIPQRPRCDYRENPVGIDSATPRLDWWLQSSDPSARGQGQTAWQILAASSPTLLESGRGDLWDSGKVASGNTTQIPYAGLPPQSHQTVWWKVRAWDAADRPGDWSPPAQWTMGVLRPEDWAGAAWIGAPDDSAPDLAKAKPKFETVLLRREFEVKPGLKRALAHVCGLGQYELSLNGAKIGQDLLTPGWTKYEKTCLYDSYDITRDLRPGPNAAGLFLGNGMYLVHGGRFAGNTKMTWAYRPLQAVALVRLEYHDGSVQTLVTDDTWRCASGPITFSSIYGGEDFDARLEPPGWNRPGFDDRTWEAARLLPGPGGRLQGLSHAAPPIRAVEKLTPVSSRQLKPGTTVHDLGQNASVMVKLRVQGPPGARVRVHPGELTKPDGALHDEFYKGQPLWWQYTTRGVGEETYEARFFYCGARYLQVDLLPDERGETPRLLALEAAVIRANATPVGEFSCADEVFNRTWRMIRSTQANNMVSILTDCPTREKRGWLEQTHLDGPALRYNWDMSLAFTKLANDMRDSQRQDGLVPTTAPHYSHWNRPFADSAEWSSACILVPWQQYEFEGDTAILSASYDMMKRYQRYLREQADKNGLIPYGIGDWMNVAPGGPYDQSLTPIPLTTTAFYLEDTRLLSRIARLLGKAWESEEFARQAEEIREDFNRAFHDLAAGYGQEKKRGSQCSNALALAMDIAPADSRPALFTSLAAGVEKNGLTVGYVGHRYLLRALTEGGRPDLVHAMHTRADKPGYARLVQAGKTSLTENWNGTDSQNHFALGHINEWFFRDLAGIQSAPDGPGFRKILIKPAIPRDLAWVQAQYDSISGPIHSAWKREGTRFQLDVTLPANTTATLHLPTDNPASIHESGAPLKTAPGIQFLRHEGKVALLQIGSGTYRFESELTF